MMRRRNLLAAAAAAFTVPTTHAASVRHGLDRSALMARQLSNAVMQDATFAGTRIVAVGERGIVLRSDDLGKSWRQVPAPVSVGLTAVCFADAARGWCVGHGGVILGTQDAGEHWTVLLDGRRPASMSSPAAEASSGPGAPDGVECPLFDVHVSPAGHVLAVGAYNLACASPDGGQHWRAVQLDNPDGLHLYAARARGRRTVICGEQGIVLRSDDSGATFQRLKTPYRGSFFTLELPSDDEIVLGGLRGNVWRSSDSGLTWSRWVVPSDAAVTASATDDQGQVLLANQAGMVLGERSGRMEVLASGLAPINGLLVLPSGDALLMSMAGTLPVTLKHEVQRLNSSGAHK